MAEPTARRRFDEPPPQPATSDVLEAIAAALDLAIDPGAPALTTTRVRGILIRCQSGLLRVQDDGGAQLIGDLERLTQDWRT